MKTEKSCDVRLSNSSQTDGTPQFPWKPGRKIAVNHFGTSIVYSPSRGPEWTLKGMETSYEGAVKRWGVPYSVVESADPAPPVRSDLVIAKDRVPCATPNFSRCVKQGLIVMNPYYTSRSEVDSNPFWYSKTVDSKTYSPSTTSFNHYVGEYVWVYPIDSDGTVTNYEWGWTFRGSISTYRILPYTSITGKKSWYPLGLTPWDPDLTISSLRKSNIANLVGTSLIASSRAAAYDLATEYAERLATLETLKDSLIKAYALLKKHRKSAASIPAFFFTPKGRRRLRNSLKRGAKKADLDKTLRGGAQYWLAYRYAYSPIAYSIQDILKAIDDQGNTFKTVREGDSIDSHESSEKVFVLDSVNDIRVEVTQNISHSYAVHGSCKMKLNINSFLQDVGLRTQIWAPTALWEVTPWSFVVDWFINIADVVQAFRPSFATSEGYSISTKEIFQGTMSTRFVGPSHFEKQVDKTVNTVSVTDYNRTSFEMTAGPSRKVESLTRVVGRPGIKLAIDESPMNWKRQLDSISLTLLQLRSLRNKQGRP